MAISNTHARIVAACATGEWADLLDLPDEAREVDAGFIRDLMLGLRRGEAEHKTIAMQFVRYAPFANMVHDAAPFFVAAPGVRIQGARIKGTLELSGCVGSAEGGLPRLALEDCVFEGLGINLSGSRIAGLSLDRSKFNCLWAPKCLVEGGVSLVGVSPIDTWSPQTFEIDDPDWSSRLAQKEDVRQTATMRESDEVRSAKPVADSATWPNNPGDLCFACFSSAIIRGPFDARSARLRGPDDYYALGLNGAEIGGPADLIALIAEGGVDVAYSTIRGTLDLTGARLIANPGHALSAEGAVVMAAVLLRQGFIARGTIWLLSARIGGNLLLAGARCDGRNRDAIVADQLEIAASLILRDALYVSGRLWFLGAKVASSIEIVNGVVLEGGAGTALLLESVVVGITIVVRSEVQMRGGLRTFGAAIGKNFELEDVTLSKPGELAWSAQGMRVGGTLRIIGNTVAGTIDLADVACGTLTDVPTGYGDADFIRLDGFRYDRIQVQDGCWRWRSRWLTRQFATPADIREPGKALKWLERIPFLYDVLYPLPKPGSLDGYHPQPYLQLARRLALQGHQEDARRILSLRRTVERKVMRRWLTGPLSWLFWLCFDYGLSAKRAVATMIVTLALGGALVWLANHRGALVVDAQSVAVVGQSSAATDLPKAVACGDQINPPIYAIDLFIPLIDLRQESKCEVGEAPGARLGPGVAIPIPGLNWTWRSAFAEVELWRWGKALYGICGWILTSLAILTFSGVLRRQAEQA